MKLIKSHPHIIFAILLIIAVAIAQLDWYWYLIGLGVYFTLYFFITMPTSLATITYFFANASKKTMYEVPLFKKIYEWCYQHKTRSQYALVSYGLELCRGFEFEHSREVLKYLLSLPDLNPTILKNARLDLAIAEWKCGNVDGAIALVEKMRVDYEYFSAPFYSSAGYFYYVKGDYDKAREYSELAIKEDASYAAAYDNLGQLEWALGNTEAAKEAFGKALRIKNLSDSHYWLGVIAESEGNLRLAAQHFSNALNGRITGFSTISREMAAAKYEQLKDHLYDEQAD